MIPVPHVWEAVWKDSPLEFWGHHTQFRFFVGFGPGLLCAAVFIPS
jgi:hypothetical protein